MTTEVQDHCYVSRWARGFSVEEVTREARAFVEKVTGMVRHGIPGVLILNRDDDTAGIEGAWVMLWWEVSSTFYDQVWDPSFAMYGRVSHEGVRSIVDEVVGSIPAFDGSDVYDDGTWEWEPAV